MTQQEATLVQLDPAELTIGTNVRLDPRLDKQFLASIKERGVLEPIVAYVEDEGEDARTVVLYGQRRSVAAAQVGRGSVPVLLVPKPAETDRLIDQMSENDHRAALTEAERIGAFEQLSGLGLSAGQIAKRGARDKAEVYAALTVATSHTARQALAQEPLTIAQAAALAEFDDDPEAVEALIEAADSGEFNHELQRRRDQRAERQAVEALTAQLAASGVQVGRDA